MAGSPTYIAELQRLNSLGPQSGNQWEGIEILWKMLKREYHTGGAADTILRQLSWCAFTIIHMETGKPWDQIFDEAIELHIAKNAGYAGADNPDTWANFREATEFGTTAYIGALIRLGDKHIRIHNLRRDPSNDRVGEPLMETMRDFGAYPLIGLSIRKEPAPL